MKSFVVGVICFCVGMAMGWWFLSRVEIKPEVKTERIYALPEGTTLQGLCNSFYGKKIEKEKEKAMEEINDWKETYKQGYLDGRGE